MRSLSPILIALALALAPLALSVPAAAQAASFKLLAEADRDLRAGQARDALRKFSQAHTQAPSARTLRGIADARAQLGDAIGARDAYRALLSQFGSRLLGAERKKVEALEQEQAAKEASLRIEVSPEGAQVQLDGRSLGGSPVREPVRVLPGRHVLRAELPEFEPGHVVIEGPPGRETLVRLVLTPLPKTGTLQVATDDPAAEILIDGKVVGRGKFEGELDPGPHEVRVRSPFRDEHVETIEIPLRERVERDLKLPVPRGALHVESEPRGASVIVDGTLIGSSPIDVELDPGLHSISLVAPGHRRGDEKITIASRQRLSRKVALKADAAGVVEDHRGLYGALILQGSVHPELSENSLIASCPGSCTSASPLGGGLGLRVGYVFDWIGVELQGLGVGDVSTIEVDYERAVPSSRPHFGPARGESYTLRRLGALGTAGVRVRSPGEVARLVVGAGFGVDVRDFGYARSVDDGTTAVSDVYAVPAAIVDISLGLGAKPGVEAQLGVWGSVAFAGTLELPGAEPGSFQGDPVGSPPMVYGEGPLLAFGPQFVLAFGQ